MIKRRHGSGCRWTEGQFQKVLLFGNDSLETELLKQMLEERSFDVVCLNNALAAVCELSEKDIDVIVCDLADDLPSETFYYAVQCFKPHLCRRFLFLTMENPGLKQGDVAQGMRGVSICSKPVQLQNLLGTMETILEKNEAGLTREIGL